MMSDVIRQETTVFFLAIALGAGLSFLYDFLRVLRRMIRHGAVATGIEDLLFWLFGAPYRLQLGTPGAITLREGQLFLPQAAPLSARDPQLLRWLASQLEPVVAGQIDRLLPSLARFCPRQPGKIQLRWMVSRWGSCNPTTGALHFSLRLAHLPPEAIEGVVAHELAHLAVPNHSAAFYQAVQRLLPDYPHRQAMLRPPVDPTTKESP